MVKDAANVRVEGHTFNIAGALEIAEKEGGKKSSAKHASYFLQPLKEMQLFDEELSQVYDSPSLKRGQKIAFYMHLRAQNVAKQIVVLNVEIGSDGRNGVRRRST